jgi:hypothetical protein
MNRFVSKTLATGMACAGLMAMLVSWSVAAEDDAVIAADKVVVAALAKADMVSADKWLDPDFTWIDSEGIMWAKTDAFRAELKPLLAGPSDSQIIEHKYGKSVASRPSTPPTTFPAITLAKPYRTNRCLRARRQPSTSGGSWNRVRRIGKGMLPTTWTSVSSAATAALHPRRLTTSLG